MHCCNHTQKEAQGACAYCGRLFCDDCLTMIDGRYYCKEHVQTVFDEQRRAKAEAEARVLTAPNPADFGYDTPPQPNGGYAPLPREGYSLPSGAPRGGYSTPASGFTAFGSPAPVPQQPYAPGVTVTNVNFTAPGAYPYSEKSRVIALILCLFFGIGGFHRFYVGKIGTGLFWLFTGGCFGIGWIVDLVCLVFGAFRDTYGRPLQ